MFLPHPKIITAVTEFDFSRCSVVTLLNTLLFEEFYLQDSVVFFNGS